VVYQISFFVLELVLSSEHITRVLNNQAPSVKASVMLPSSPGVTYVCSIHPSVSVTFMHHAKAAKE